MNIRGGKRIISFITTSSSMFWFKVLNKLGENKGRNAILDIIKGPLIASRFLLDKIKICRCEGVLDALWKIDLN